MALGSFYVEDKCEFTSSTNNSPGRDGRGSDPAVRTLIPSEQCHSPWVIRPPGVLLGVDTDGRPLELWVGRPK